MEFFSNMILIKETKNVLSSDKDLIRVLAIITYIGLEYMRWRRPRQYLKVLYCAEQNSGGLIFGHFFVRT